jgi:hypothetical protein
MDNSHADPRRPATVEEVKHLCQPAAFVIGDKVRWRQGLRNASWPPDDMVCVVSQVITPPVYNTIQTTSNEGAACNDIALAVIHSGYIEEYLYDSRRFERVSD